MLLGVIQNMKNASAKFSGFVVHPNIFTKISLYNDALFIFNFFFFPGTFLPGSAFKKYFSLVLNKPK